MIGTNNFFTVQWDYTKFNILNSITDSFINWNRTITIPSQPLSSPTVSSAPYYSSDYPQCDTQSSASLPVDRPQLPPQSTNSFELIAHPKQRFIILNNRLPLFRKIHLHYSNNLYHEHPLIRSLVIIYSKLTFLHPVQLSNFSEENCPCICVTFTLNNYLPFRIAYKQVNIPKPLYQLSLQLLSEMNFCSSHFSPVIPRLLSHKHHFFWIICKNLRTLLLPHLLCSPHVETIFP